MRSNSKRIRCLSRRVVRVLSSIKGEIERLTNPAVPRMYASRGVHTAKLDKETNKEYLMFRRTISAVLFAALLAVPGTTFAKPGDPPLKRERHKYLVLYFKVKAQEGKRAPGRQILRQGVRKHHKAHPATAKEVANSIRQLRMLLNPMQIAGAPAQAPAGVLTSHANGTLERIAACESHGSPTAVDPTGTYRGKYQFDYRTWAGVGGHGDPAAASEAEQDMRAGMLYAQRGAAPWPVCGYK